MSTSPSSTSPLTRREIEACVDAAAAVLGIPIAPEDRDGVVAAFSTAAACAGRLDDPPLRLDDASALVFATIGPGDAPLPDRRRR
ncbi:MAG TPA: AtzG-like protein [Caldimonas sp.]|nr:AtzG-like protein [Caldimonas sp.]